MLQEDLSPDPSFGDQASPPEHKTHSGENLCECTTGDKEESHISSTRLSEGSSSEETAGTKLTTPTGQMITPTGMVTVSSEVQYVQYKSELQMPDIMRLMKVDLSEPYSIYTYRYFIHKWPHLCFLAECDGKCVGAIVCKLEAHQSARRHDVVSRGYIAMLAVDKDYRKRKIGSTLVKMCIQRMASDGCDEVVLETEVTNKAALGLYENLGFIRDKYLYQYYLNGEDAYRLKLWLTDTTRRRHT